MTHPKAYSPQEGYKYQILCRHPEYNGREWEHCDYATDNQDKKHLLTEYRLAYGSGYAFKTIRLPEKYWPEKNPHLTPALKALLKEKSDYIFSCGGPWEVTEFDQDLNRINREIIDEFHKIHPNTHLGKVNLRDDDKPLTPYSGFVYNFGCAFIVPEYNEKLYKEIAKYNDMNITTDKMSGLGKQIDVIFDIVESLNGIIFQWV